MMMAYYPGDYYHYYSRGLFDPYSTDAYNDDRPHYPEYPPSSSTSPIAHTSASTSTGKRKRSPSPPSPSPPPPVTPQTRPSPAYLAFSSKPSKALPEPTRKLLILDLNGTLLLRSPRPPKSSRGQYYHKSHPAPRRVMPRPYLAALRAYLFAPETRTWLDVMVWSSAQPHSVEDMVSHALGEDRERLVAIWARDTLGLGDDHYYRKVQTIKDLEKPWAALNPRLLRPASTSLIDPKLQHSAATTLLVDDSQAKAALQPYNHLCVPEYTRTQRNEDLAVLQLERAIQQRQQHQQQKQQQQQQQHSSISHQEASPPSTAPDTTANTNTRERLSSPDGSSTTTEKEQDGHKRKRRKKKKVKVLEPQLEEEEQQPATDGTSPAEAAVFDETLLAVIGILHAARLQCSIAGWVRAGALFSPPTPPFSDSERAGVAVVVGDASKTMSAWCDDLALVRAWAGRGREAMHELGLKVEHGIET